MKVEKRISNIKVTNSPNRKTLTFFERKTPESLKNLQDTIFPRDQILLKSTPPTLKESKIENNTKFEEYKPNLQTILEMNNESMSKYYQTLQKSENNFTFFKATEESLNLPLSIPEKSEDKEVNTGLCTTNSEPFSPPKYNNSRERVSESVESKSINQRDQSPARSEESVRSEITISPSKDSNTSSEYHLQIEEKEDYLTILESKMESLSPGRSGFKDLLTKVDDINRKHDLLVGLTEKLCTDNYMKYEEIINDFIKRHSNDRYLKPLSIFQVEVVDHLWRDSKIPGETLVAKHSHILEVMTARNLKTLSPGTWLNDEVINAYLRLVDKKLEESGSRSRIMNTFFFDQACCGKSTDKNKIMRMLSKKHVDPKTLSKLFIPINIKQTHWCFAVIDFDSSSIAIYDSINRARFDCEGLISLANTIQQEKTLLKQSKERSKEPATSTEESFTHIDIFHPYPKQVGTCDCGVFMIKGIQAYSSTPNETS